MTNLVNFLAQVGQDSSLSRASSEELQAAMERAGLTAAERMALSNADRHEMEVHAGARSNACCIVFPAEESDEGQAVPAPQMRTAA